MEKGTMGAKYFMKMYKAIEHMNGNRRNKDANRNHTNYGAATAYADVLRDMGHAVDLLVYGDGEYLVSDRIRVDDNIYDIFVK